MPNYAVDNVRLLASYKNTMALIKTSITIRPFLLEAVKKDAKARQLSVSATIERALEQAYGSYNTAEPEQDDYTYTKEELIATFDKAKENCVMFDTAEEAEEYIKSGKPYGSIGFSDPKEFMRSLHMSTQRDE